MTKKKKISCSSSKGSGSSGGDAWSEKIVGRLDDVVRMISGGATQGQVAQFLGIHPNTFTKMKKKHPELQEAITLAQRNLAVEIRAALVKKALGGYPVVTTKVTSREVRGEIVTTTETTTKVAEADVKACEALLGNIEGSQWYRDKNAYELKKREVDLKEKTAERDAW